MSSLAGKLGIVFGVANKRSIAWAIAQAWHKAGAKLAFTYQGERLKENVEELAGTFGGDTLILPCDVTRDEEIANVFKTVTEKFGKLHLLLAVAALVANVNGHAFKVLLSHSFILSMVYGNTSKPCDFATSITFGSIQAMYNSFIPILLA